MTYEPMIWGRLLKNLCPSAERWLETKPTCFVQGPTRTDQKGKRTSFLSSEQEMKARFMVMSQEQIASHPSGRVIILPFKRVEADEVRLHKHFVCFLEQWGNSSEGVFSSLPTCESTLLYKSTKGFYGSCWEKMPKSGLHRIGFCIMTTRHGTRIYGFFQCLTKNDDGIWPLYFSTLVFMAYSSYQR